MSREQILNGISVERNRQDGLWGNDFDDKNTPNDWVAYVNNYLAQGAYDGRSEEYTVEKFRIALVKAATICVAAIEAIDRNGKCADRHYDKKENETILEEN
ncbi:hypothetical protein LCGC14_0360110 [marine sediment metagenome]|uniref:dATP/dGTP diphosphohydrolase N-terminal domain-containing protein n=1 Tax=marine sediment metagenome TaxID=412755 RepID=A0A0F9TR85_9ZZZZ